MNEHQNQSIKDRLKNVARQQKWLAFIRRTGIDANTSFAEIINDLESFFIEILPRK